MLSINYECPPKYNPADYFIEILAWKLNGKNNRANIQASKTIIENLFTNLQSSVITTRQYAILMRIVF